jgi:EAL domain-containing protein (putative c-di-GMP-specific phosphodiesterase class I)/GGDEF domain-containing protein
MISTMLYNEISASELHLLETTRAAMVKLPKPLCADFYDYLDANDHPHKSLLKQSFEQLLLNEQESILDAIAIDSFTTPKQLLSLFDQYLGCMAIRIPRLVQNAEQAHIAMECLRKLAFDLLQKILAKQSMLPANPQRKLSRKTDSVFEHAMPQEQFILSCNQLLSTERTRDFAILAIQFDFGIHSNNAIQYVLSEIALKLRQIMGPDDLLTHISARRWAICLQHESDLAPVISTVEKLKAQFSNPIAINGIATLVNAYIGIALSNRVQKDADFLLQSAFNVSSMPSHHRERYQVYDPELDAESKRLDHLSAELRYALASNTLELYYQPKYSNKTNKIIGLETLLRWRNGEDNVPIPLIFRLIERDHLLRPFTTWLLENTFKHLLEFLQRGIDIQLSVNILPQNLNEPDFISMLSALLELWKIPRDRLTIEITEGSLLQDAEETIEVLQAIRKMGLKLSLDDFGTGYSSLSYLSRLPINEIKIDQAFVSNMFLSERDLAIVRTVIELGHNFHLDLVAEGVEDSKTAEKLSALGCDTMQGFWISKPVSYAELISWFDNDTKHIWQRLPNH